MLACFLANIPNITHHENSTRFLAIILSPTISLSLSITKQNTLRGSPPRGSLTLNNTA